MNQHQRKLDRRSLALLCILVMLPGSTWAESGTKKPPGQTVSDVGSGNRIYAEPIIAGDNPYEFNSYIHRKLPVAANGFSVVALKNQHKWQSGKAIYQTVFDGQLYWFTNVREKKIFESAPDKYAPTLGGDSVVTFAESGARIYGDPRFGVVHRDRIYFFASDMEREQFKQNPENYIHADLVNDGNCVVSKIDQRKKIQGIPGTVAIVGGLRYYFAGTHQRAIFASNPTRYGVKSIASAELYNSRMNSDTINPTPKKQSQTNEDQQKRMVADSAGNQQSFANAKPLIGETSDEESLTHTIQDVIPVDKLGMEGYCPVSIREQGIWVKGVLEFRKEIHGKSYLFAGEIQKEKFLKSPQSYLPALEGDCLVTLVDKNRRESGSVYHSAFDKQKNIIYLFAGPEEHRMFNANRKAYIDAAQVKTEQAQYNDEEEEATANKGNEK